MSAPKGNKYAIGNNGGRPPIYSSPEELSQEIDAYFEYIKGEYHLEKRRVRNEETKEWEDRDVRIWERESEPATITGLALYLGFCGRQALSDYEKHNEYSDIIKRGRTRVEHEYEKRLDGDKPTGAIFALKNMKWRDNLDVTTDGESLNKKQPVMKLPDGTIVEI